jgi:hypothetical protein
MSTPFQALVTELRGLDGAPKVTYPEGNAAYPTVERVLRLKRGLHLPTFFEGDPDAGRFPNNQLTLQTELKSDPQWVEVYRKYEVLPGPVMAEFTVFGSTGIPLIVARQKVKSTTLYAEGEFAPAALSVSVIGTGNPCTVTLTAGHNLPLGAWVKFAGTNSSPALPADQAQIVGVPAFNQVQVSVPAAIMGTGSMGSMQAIHRVVREIKPTENGNVNVKMETTLAAPDPAAFNEDIKVFKEYPFPNYLQAINLYNETAFARDASFGSSASINASYGGAVGLPTQAGYRGPCEARRRRYFFMGPPPDSFAQQFPPTIIIPSIGTFVIEGGSYGRGVSGANISNAKSTSYRTGVIGEVLTGPDPEVTETGTTIAISSISTASPASAVTPKITLASVHGMSSEAFVQLTNTGTTPSLDGIWQIISIPTLSSFQVQPPVALTSGSSGVGKCRVLTTESVAGAGLASCMLDLPESIPAKIIGHLGISSIGTGAAPLITLSADHYLKAGQWVELSGTNSSPPLSGFYQIATTPASNTLTLVGAPTVNIVGHGGTLQNYLTQADQPQKLDTAGLWQCYVWLIKVPYTSGDTP